MVRSLTSVVLALAVLLPGFAWPAPSGPGGGSGAHACCLRLKASGCATTIGCCPAPERGREASQPPASTSTGAAPSQAQPASSGDTGAFASLVKALAFDAHALARANAPPGPLYLKHLTLLV
jgi:hypothetical protein